MRELRAVLFGNETLFDRHDVERKAYNRVFAEAGLSWNWGADDYMRLCRLSGGGDVIEAFIRFDRPGWGLSDDLSHLLAAVRRRHAFHCQAILTELADVDREMIAVARIARSIGLRLCAISAGGLASGRVGDIALVSSHEGAVAALGVPRYACVAIECTAVGFRAAADAGIAALDKSSIAADPDAFSSDAILAALAHGNADKMPPPQLQRRSVSALTA